MSSTLRTCSVLNAPGMMVSLAEIEPMRLPSTAGLSIPEACQADLTQLLDGWQDDDAKNFDNLSKRICSYKLGWIEKVPGTCHAGGPPPLCPVDHWTNVGPILARSKMADQEAPTRDAREQELIQAACHCKRRILEHAANQPPPVLANSQVFNGYAPSPYTVPCTYGCPIGTSCHESMCRPNNAQETLTEAAKDKAADLGLDQLKDQAKTGATTYLISAAKSSQATEKIGEAIAEAVELSETFTLKTTIGVFAGLLQPTMLSTDRDLYDREAETVAGDLKLSQGLYRELADSMAGRPARAPQYIRGDLDAVKGKLRDDLGTLNNAYSAVVNEHLISPRECPDVFEWQQQAINQSIVDVVALP